MKKIVLFFCILFLPAFLNLLIAQDVPAKPTMVKTGVFVGISKPLRDIPPISGERYDMMLDNAKKRAKNTPWDLPSYPYASTALPKGPDAVWQKSHETAMSGGSRAPIQYFEGQTSPYYPPDCNGATGPNHYMQTVNTTYAIYSKTGTLLAGPTAMNSLFGSVAGATYNDGDPIVLYDEQADRWLAVEFSVSGSNDFMLMAVSTTNDPTGTWYQYSFDVVDMPDYEKMAVWRDGYYMGTNTQPATGNDIYVFERSQMLVGGTARMVAFDNPYRPGTGVVVVPPVDNDGVAAPVGTPGTFIAFNDDGVGGGSDQLWLYELAVNWTTPASSTFNRTQQINVSSFDSEFSNGWDNITQPGTSMKLCAISTVIMNVPQYRNFGTYQSIVCCHTVDVGTDHAGVRWYELRKTPPATTWTLRQQGTYAPDAHSRWMGSIAMNGSNKIAIGYSLSSSTEYPGIRYAGQSAAGYASASGVMDVPEVTAHTGANYQYTYNRWGDYSSMSIDPTDDQTFWFTTQYIGASEARRTKILSFQIGSNPLATTLAATSVTGTSATLNGTVNPNGLATSYHFEYGTSTSYGYNTSTISAGSGTSNISVNAGISGLTTGTPYHFRLVAVNSDGTTNGNDLIFIPGGVILTTTAATAITQNTATSGGNIASDGGSAITARGVCWATTADPVATGFHTTNGSGTGNFVSSITGLQSSTLYHVRAYATNANGTFYGDDLTFTTSCGEFTPPFTQNFSGGSLPSCWTIVDNQGNGQVWQFGSISGPSLTAPYAYLDSDGYGSGNTQNTDLVTPTLNLAAYTNVTLQFNHYFRSYSGSSGTLSYSINNGSTWTTISTYTANTANPAAFSQVIAAVAGQSQVKFKWNYTGTWGYYWAVDDISVTGTLVSPTLSVTPSNQNVTPPAGSTAFTVTSNSAWTAVSSQGWCTVTPSGTGNGTITATYTENNTASQRVANVTVTVTGLSPVVVTVTQAAPTLAVSPANQNVAAAAGTTPFSVTSNASWTAASNQGWCTVTPSGTGNGTITATFTENTSVTARVANVTVTVSGLTPIVVTVSQAGATPVLTVTPSTQNVTAPAGSTAFTVTSNTSWTVISDQTWCTVTPSGSGNGSITASYTQNTTTSPRTANVTVSASGVSPVVVTVVQAGVPESEFLLTIQNVIQTAPNVFEFDIFLLDVDASVPFQLATIQEGINFNTAILNGAAQTTGMTTIVPGSSQLPSNMEPISVNTATAGLIRIAGRAAPGAGNGYIVSTVAPGTRMARLRMTNSVAFASGTTPNMVFTPSTAITPSYATRVAKYEGTVNTQLPVVPGNNANVLENPVLNGSPTLNVTPASQSVATAAGAFGYSVSSNAAWSAVSDQPWCTIAPASGFGNGTLTASYTQNTGAPRSANITVSVSGLSDVTVVLNQDGITTKTLNLYALLEGLYNGSGTMRQANDEYGAHFGAGIADVIDIELHNSSDYSIIEHDATNTDLSTSGNATVVIPPALSNNYYITVKHRNSIETTSANPVSFAGPVISYAFDLPVKAFGGNLLQMIDGYYTIYGGDVNQDGTIDTGDGTPIDNDQFYFVSGYVVTDINGDGTVDTGDGTIVDNNQFFFVGTVLP
ncbi:MAG: BACON domain-containing carbohydrate-binding protein [Bacteroidota bacterium]